MQKIAAFNPLTTAWTEETLPVLSRYFENRPPQELLQAALARFKGDIVLATGFGPSGVALMHMASQIDPQTPVFYLQTDMLFKETMELRDRLTRRLGINFVEVHCGLSLTGQTREYGPNLWQRNPDLCCYLRKVLPLRRYLAGKQAWITGIRRDQSPSRAEIQLIAWDRANGLVKLNPLACWTRREVWGYIFAHNLPYNPLHDRGYPSIGCEPCTRPVTPGEENERAGRWSGWSKTECGIHLQSSTVAG